MGIDKRPGMAERFIYEKLQMSWFVEPDFHDSSYEERFKGKIALRAEFLYDLTTAILCKLHAKSGLESKSFGKRKILFTSQNAEWKVVRDISSNKMKKSDAFFDSIINELQKEGQYDLIATYPLGRHPFDGLRIIRDKEQNWDVIQIPFNTHWSWNIWKEERKANRHFQKVWTNLRDTEMDEAFKKPFPVSFEIIFGRIIRYTKMAEKLIENEKPDLIVIVNEYGIWEKSLIVAAKIKGIPTLAIQHGIIHPYHPGYLHSIKEFSGKRLLRNISLPDKIAVYGEYTKNLLINVCNYPADTIVITGQPRYDILSKSEKLFSKKNFMTKYGLDESKKVALLITQEASMSFDFLIAVVRALKNFPEVQTVIKPHPCDIHFGWHYKILEKEGYCAIVLDPKAYTFESLYASDVVLTVNSTTAIEAMILDKPVVIVNLTGQPDAMPYVKSGAAIGVNREQDVHNAIFRALYDNQSQEELANGRLTFVRMHVHQIGQGTENIVKLINQMIETGV
ncbi:MAG: glycosyltransferase [Candidatus Bathyarchaeia archaeon]|jgi:hypothetical protein